MDGIAAVLPLAITTARRAMSRSPPTLTVWRSVRVPSPRISFAPVASSAAAGRLSTRSRAIHRTRLETLGKSTDHSTRDAARRRARSASIRVSPDRSKVLEGTQPQYRALAADEFSLDDRQRQSAVLKALGDRLSGDARSETHDVKLLRHFHFPDSPASPAAWEVCSPGAHTSISPGYRPRPGSIGRATSLSACLIRRRLWWKWIAAG